MSRWETWPDRAARAGGLIANDFSNIHANIATDCSGLGIPELAMKSISNVLGIKFQVMFAWDNLLASQRFLERNAKPLYMLGDIGERVFRATSFATTAVDGKAAPDKNRVNDLSVYLMHCMILIVTRPW